MNKSDSLPATKADLNSATARLTKEILSTKADLNSAAARLTKEIVSTKTDLDSATARLTKEIVSTKTDLDSAMARLAKETKADLNSAAARLAKEIVSTQADVRGIKETIATLMTKKDGERILTAMEKFAGKAEAYDRLAVLHGHVLTETSVALRDHEKRLQTIEGQRRPT